MAKRQKPLVGNHAVHQLANALRPLGFSDTTKTSSRYLRFRGVQFRLRLSDHHWSSHSARRYLDVVHSEVVSEIDPRDLQLVAVETGVRFVAAARLRLGLIRSDAAC